MRKIYIFEPYFFLFFGLFHLHRIWGLIDRYSYADFWLKVMENKGAIYFILMGILSALCILGIIAFFRDIHQNYWWRWIYLFGGGYVLFDLFAIAIDLEFWRKLLYAMFDTSTPYWNWLWGSFVVMGGISMIIGFVILKMVIRNTLSGKQYDSKNHKK